MEMLTLEEHLYRLYCEGDEFFQKSGFEMPSNLFDNHHRTMTTCMLANFHYANQEGRLPSWDVVGIYNLRGNRSKRLTGFDVKKEDRLSIIRAGLFYMEVLQQYRNLSPSLKFPSCVGLFGFILCDRLNEIGLPRLLDSALVARCIYANAELCDQKGAVLCRGGETGYNKVAQETNRDLYILLGADLSI